MNIIGRRQGDSPTSYTRTSIRGSQALPDQIDRYADAIMRAAQDSVAAGTLPSNLAAQLQNDFNDVHNALANMAEEQVYVGQAYNQAVQSGGGSWVAIIGQTTDHIIATYQALIDACQTLQDTGITVARSASPARQIVKPTGLSDIAIGQYAEQLQYGLQRFASQSAAYLKKGYTDRLKEALNEQDDATAYVLVSPVMQLWLENCGLSSSAREDAIAEATGLKAKPQYNYARSSMERRLLPSSSLTSMLSDGAQGSLQSLLTTCKSKAYVDMQGLIRLMRGYAGTQGNAVVQQLQNATGVSEY